MRLSLILDLHRPSAAPVPCPIMQSVLERGSGVQIANALNNIGQVVGMSQGNVGYVATIWNGTTPTMLAPLDPNYPSNQSDAKGINDARQVVGFGYGVGPGSNQIPTDVPVVWNTGSQLWKGTPGTGNSTWARPNRGRAGPGRHDPEVGCSTPGVIWDLDESSLERASAQQKPAYTLIRHYLLTNQLHLPSAPPRCASGLPVINCAFFRIP